MGDKPIFEKLELKNQKSLVYGPIDHLRDEDENLLECFDENCFYCNEYIVLTN
jgi:hypothetical protein